MVTRGTSRGGAGHHRQMLAEVVIYRRERAVVRLGDVCVKADTNGDRIEREVAALARAPLPSARVLWHRRGQPHVLALSEVRGDPRAVLGSPSRHARDAWVAAESAARTLHCHPVPADLSRPSRYLLEDLDELEGWLHSYGVADRRVVTAHADRARAARNAGRADVFHPRDFQAAHVLVSNDGTVEGVIDWGDAGLGNPHYDLALLTVGHGEHLDAVLHGYATRSMSTAFTATGRGDCSDQSVG